VRVSEAALLFLAAVACRKADEPEKPTALAVQVVKASRGDVSEIVEVSGELSALPGMDVKLGPLVAGRLGAVLVGEGDAVRQGQVLARLDATPLRDALSQAQAQEAQARAQERNAAAKLGRAEQALKAGVAAAQEVEDDRLALAQAEGALKSAQAALSTARNQLGRSELRAPFDGVVAHLFAAAGEPLDANKPVVEVARISPLELRAPIAPALAARVRPGQPASLHVDALAARDFPAQVVAISPTIDAATGAALVRLRADNPDGALRIGSFARAQIAVDLRRGALRVPEQALLSGPDGAAVEVVQEGKAKRTPVKVEAKDGRFAAIGEGLAEGAEVIVQGNYALPDGTPVQAQPAQAQPAQAPGALR
jgi:RND family efflux transporter MFP subunit